MASFRFLFFFWISHGFSMDRFSMDFPWRPEADKKCGAGDPPRRSYMWGGLWGAGAPPTIPYRTPYLVQRRKQNAKKSEKLKNLIFGQKQIFCSIWRFSAFWRDRMERKHILHRNGPRASNILSHRIVESLKFMIFGNLIFHGSIFHGFPMEAGGRQKLRGGWGGGSPPHI